MDNSAAIVVYVVLIIGMIVASTLANNQLAHAASSNGASGSANQTNATLATTFNEQGLPANLQWSVNYDGKSNTTQAPGAVTFTSNSGTQNYRYDIPVLTLNTTQFNPSPSGGNLPAGSSQTINFTVATIFITKNLPINATWQVTYDGATEHASSLSYIQFNNTYGSYQFSVGYSNFSNTVYYPNITSGALNAGGYQVITYNAVNVTQATTTIIPSNSATNTSTSTSTSSSTTSSTTTILANSLSTNSITTNSITTNSISNQTNTTVVTPLTKSNIFFKEEGLPSSATWNVVYNGTLASSSSTNIIFENVPSQRNFDVANQLIGGVLYVPAPGTGIALQENAIIDFQTAYNLTYTKSNQTSEGKRLKPSGSGKSYLNTKGKTLRGVYATFSTNSISYNITISTQTQPFNSIPAVSNPSYQYVSINASVVGSSTNIDNYVSNVTYNFAVPQSWMSSQNASYSEIHLDKYEGTGWVQLPTTFAGQNSTSYFFNATSNSFSVYAMTVNAVATTASTSNLLITAPSGYEYYVWAEAAESRTAANTIARNFTTLANQVVQAGTGVNSHLNATSIGNTPLLIQTANIAWNHAQTLPQISMAGIGINAIFKGSASTSVVTIHGNIITNSVAPTVGNSALQFKVPLSNSVVLLLFASAGNAIENPGWPAGCRADSYVTTQNSAVATANCIFVQSSGTTYTYNVPANMVANTVGVTTMHTQYALAAFIFTPDNVFLRDVPTTANIITNGTQQRTGNTIFTLGTGAMNATNALTGGNYVFSSFAADTANTANFIIQSPYTENSFVTIMGNGIITATWNALWVTLSNSFSIMPINGNQVITANVANGISPITYNFLIYSPVGTLVDNALYSSVSFAQNTFTYQQNPAWGTGVFRVNVIATDTSTQPVTTIANVMTYNAQIVSYFNETGLPLGATWNAVYNSLSYYNSITTPNEILVGTVPQSLDYAIANVVVFGIKYVPNPNNGLLVAGNAVGVAFSAQVATPRNVLFYIPINIINNQGNPTPAPFQAMVQFNSIAFSSYETGNLMNIEFFYQNSTIIPSWLEGNSLIKAALAAGTSNTATNTIYWLNITAGIPAKSVLTVFMGFAGTANNLFNGNTIGEAPELTCSPTITNCANGYAQFDNGNVVFPFYDNFFGKTLSSLWSSTVSGPVVVTETQNNGIILVKGSSALSYWGIVSNIAYPTTPYQYVLEGDVNNYASSGGTPAIGFSQTNSQTFTTSGPNLYGNGYRAAQNATTYTALQSLTSAVDSNLKGQGGLTDPVVTGVSWAASGTENIITNYNSIASSDVTTSLPSTVYFSVSEGGGAQSAGANVVWVRARYNPPNSVMPASVNSIYIVAASNSVVLSYPYGVLGYGNTETIQALQPPSYTDSLEILITGGTFGTSDIVATGTGNIVYTFPVVSGGTYTVNAYDTLTGLSTTNTITVVQGTPILTLPNFPTNGPYNGTQETFTANVQSFGNQVQANDYITNAVTTPPYYITAFTTQNTFLANSLPPGNYVFTVNSLATANYIAASNTLTFTITKATPALTESGSGIGFGSGTISYAISTFNNQLTANLIVGGVVVSSTTTSSSYPVSPGPTYTFNAETLGNGNYLSVFLPVHTLVPVARVPASAVPANIVYYVQIPVFNSQPLAIPANFPDHIVLNAANYTALEGNAMRNIEFFDINGNILTSWMEDNNTNTSQATDFWVKLPYGLGAQQTTNVYIGFAPTANNLLNGNTVGQAADLNYLFGWNGRTQWYGQYDNGANVFTAYWNFSGTTLPTSFNTKVNSVPTVVNNGLTISPGVTATYTALQTTATYSAGNALDFYGEWGGSLGVGSDYYTQVGFGGAFATSQVAIGQDTNKKFELSGSTSSATQYASTQFPYVPYNPAYYSLGFNTVWAYGQANFSAQVSGLTTVTDVPTTAQPVEIVGASNMKLVVQWLDVRQLPPNGVMPAFAFGCVYNAISTNTCVVPTIYTSNNPSWYNYSDTITASAPEATSTDPVSISINGSQVASGTGTVTFNANVLGVGTYNLTAEDTSTLAKVTENLTIWPTYDYANVILPNYNPLSTYVYNQGGSLGNLLPMASWNSSNPGIIYIDTSDNLDLYEPNGIVKTIATITPLYTSASSPPQYSNMFYVQGEHYQYVMIEGTKVQGSGDNFLQLVNLTNGNIIMLDSGHTTPASDNQWNYLTNGIAAYTNGGGSGSTVTLFSTVFPYTSWTGNTLDWYIQNNDYWVPAYNAFVNVEAGGSSADMVEEFQLTNTIRTGKPILYKAASYTTWGGSAKVDGVYGVEYDATDNSVAWQLNEGETTPASPEVNCCHFITIVAQANSAGVLQAADTTALADVWPGSYATYGPEFTPLPTLNGSSLGATWYPHRIIYYSANLYTAQNPESPAFTANQYITGITNPFAGGYSAVALIPPSEQWLFNYTRYYECLCTFYYNNSNYGIAPASSYSLSEGSHPGNIIWYWNSSDSEWPSSVTFTETGLPLNGESWTVDFNGNTVNYVVANSIMYFTQNSIGSYSYTVPTQIIGGTTYTPSSSSGTANVGSLVPITFTASSSGQCGIELSNSFIVFGNVNPAASKSTSNEVSDINYLGSTNANIIVEGTNWTTSSTPYFYVSNTLWNPSSSPAYIGNQLYLQPGNFQDTNILIPGASTGNIFFGVRIPPQQVQGTYTQNIIIENLC